MRRLLTGMGRDARAGISLTSGRPAKPRPHSTWDSIRRSGTSHSRATITDNTTEIHGWTNARPIAAAYETIEISPLKSLFTAFASFDVGPSIARIAAWRIVYDTAAMSITMP